jgi:hypothetical protein
MKNGPKRTRFRITRKGGRAAQIRTATGLTVDREKEPELFQLVMTDVRKGHKLSRAGKKPRQGSTRRGSKRFEDGYLKAWCEVCKGLWGGGIYDEQEGKYRTDRRTMKWLRKTLDDAGIPYDPCNFPRYLQWLGKRLGKKACQTTEERA